LLPLHGNAGPIPHAPDEQQAIEIAQKIALDQRLALQAGKGAAIGLVFSGKLVDFPQSLQEPSCFSVTLSVSSLEVGDGAAQRCRVHLRFIRHKNRPQGTIA
jgi:hypothetical protein